MAIKITITPCEYITACPCASGWCNNGESAQSQCMPFLQSALKRLAGERDAEKKRADAAVCDLLNHAVNHCMVCGDHITNGGPCNDDNRYVACFIWRGPCAENTDAPTGAESEGKP